MSCGVKGGLGTTQIENPLFFSTKQYLDEIYLRKRLRTVTVVHVSVKIAYVSKAFIWTVQEHVLFHINFFIHDQKLHFQMCSITRNVNFIMFLCSIYILIIELTFFG